MIIENGDTICMLILILIFMPNSMVDTGHIQGRLYTTSTCLAAHGASRMKPHCLLQSLGGPLSVSSQIHPYIKCGSNGVLVLEAIKKKGNRKKSDRLQQI